MEKELEQDDSLLSGIKRSLNYIALPSRNKYLKSQEDKLADIDRLCTKLKLIFA